MDRKLSILVVEDDQIECQALTQYAASLTDVSIVGATNNSTQALEYAKDKIPDAIILDLELHEGSGNGLTFLREIKSLNLKFKPYILVTTNNTSPVTYEYARKSGADFIMSKYQDEYSAKSVIDFLRDMKAILHSKRSYEDLPNILLTTENQSHLSKRIIQRIHSELDIIGVNQKLIGFRYLTDAILLVMKNPESDIFRNISEKYGKSDFSVERAIQHAINKTWRTSDIDDLSKHYTAKISSAKGTPTINEFVYYYANKIANDY